MEERSNKYCTTRLYNIQIAILGGLCRIYFVCYNYFFNIYVWQIYCTSNLGCLQFGHYLCTT